MYVEIIKSNQRGKTYKTVLLRESFRQNGKVKHRTVANLSKLPAPMVTLLKQTLSGKGDVSLEKIVTSRSKELGASFALLELARDIGLDKIIYSRPERWRQNALAMIIGRIIWQGSKLSLTNMFKDTALWELCGHEADVQPSVNEDCYAALDELLARQRSIQKKLADKHLKKGCLVLYDMTNIWLEGEYADSELAEYGMGKAGKRGFKQIAIGLVTNEVGCPVAVEVFKGNTSDQSTVWGQAQKLAESFKIEEVILAGDRGMLTPKRIEEVNQFGFKTLTALTHPQIKALLDKQNIEQTLFDEKTIVEVLDSDNKQLRYMLCKNPETMRRERQTRQSMIQSVSNKLDEMAKVHKKRDPQKVCSRVGELFGKYKIGKFFTWAVDDNGGLTYHLDEKVIADEAALDGCYIIRVDVSAKLMNKEEAVAGYMALRHVEKAFRNLKTVALEMRPVYHKTDQRICSHIFVCFLSYYLLWHVRQRLAPLFDEDGKHEERRWSMSGVIERLKSLRQENWLIDGTVIKIQRSTPDDEQQKILDLLGVKWL